MSANPMRPERCPEGHEIEWQGAHGYCACPWVWNWEDEALWPVDPMADAWYRPRMKELRARVAAERARAERAEADVAALRLALKETSHYLIHSYHFEGTAARDEEIHDAMCGKCIVESALFSTDHPGTPLLDALCTARKALKRVVNRYDDPRSTIGLSTVDEARTALAKIDASLPNEPRDA